MTPDFDAVIGNQYVWNGCTSWATMADFIRVRVAEGYPIEKYSRLAVWWMARKLYGQQINNPNWVNMNQGDTEDNALQTLVDFGPILEQYDPEDFAVDTPTHNWIEEYKLQPPDKWMANEKLSWSQIYQIDCSNPDQKLADVLDALAQGHAVLASLTVYKSIFNVGPNGIVPDPGPNDEIDGGHEVNLTNALPDVERIKFPNSWGQTWGENGNGYFSYDYIKKYATELFVIVPLPKLSLSASFAQPSVQHGQPNSITIHTNLPNQSYAVSTVGPQANFPENWSGVTDGNGNSTHDMMFEVVGEYIVTVTCGSQSIQLNARWD